MKRWKWGISLAGLIAIPMLMWGGTAYAQRFSNTVDEDDTVNGSVYAMSKTVEIKGTIKGDVFCIGQTVVIDAKVQGDVICAGQDVTIAGTVDGDIRVAGQTVSIDAMVSRNATVAAMTFSLDAGASVGRDLTANGDSLNIKGKVGRDVVAGGNTVTLNGPIGRHAKVDSTTLQLKADAAVSGNVTYTSPKDATLDKGATVEGKTIRTARQTDQGPRWRFNLGFYAFILGSFLLIGLTLAFFFPRLMQGASTRIKQGMVRSLLIGVAASILLSMTLIALLVSVVGIPLAVLILLTFIVMSGISGPIAAYYVGQLILKKQKNPLLIVLVGGVVTVTACFLPFVGFIAILVAYWWGLGALVLLLKDHTHPGATPLDT